MKHNYTSNLIIKYLYGELSILKKLELEFHIGDNQKAREEFRVMKRGVKSLPKISFYPSEGVISRILRYSQESAINTSY